MSAIYLIRHGQASFGAQDYDQLSARGAEQGRALGRWFAQLGLPFDQAICGSLRRHRQTAEACLEQLNAPPALQIDAGFDEYDHQEMLLRAEPAFADPQSAGAFLQGHDNPRKAFQAVFVRAFARWTSGLHDADYRESWPTFRDRCLAALDRVMNAAPRSSTIVVFTSGGPISAITHRLLGTAEDRLSDLNASIANASITRILFQPGHVTLNSLNTISHLEAADDPALVTYR